MKLRRLTIQNIASIEEGEIDFDTFPLEGCGLFLIHGKTGAGKTTILDAISLALYGTTPRMKSTSMKGKYDDCGAEVSVSDSRQLMRRHTGSASVRLTFLGSDGVEYEASWSVRRARNKPTGRIMGAERELKRLDTGYTYSKVSEVNEQMKNALGLDFEEFRRTTMLAQGEFTKFLNSEDSDKSAILEKLTGVDIYSDIGRRVYDIYSEHKSGLDKASERLKGLTLLTEEEIQAHEKEIEAEIKHSAEIKTADELNEKKLQWFETRNNLAEKISGEKKLLEEATDAIASESFKADMLLIDRWRATIIVREKLKHERAERDAAAEREKIILQLRESAIDFAASTAAVKEGLVRTENEIKAVCESLEADKDLAPYYEEVPHVLADLRNLESRRAERHKIQNEKDNASDTHARLYKDLKKKEAAGGKLSQEEREQQSEVEELRKKLETADVEQARKRKERAVDMSHKTSEALRRLSLLEKARLEHRKDLETLERLRKRVTELKKEEAEAAVKAKECKLVSEACRKTYDLQRDSISKWTKSLRAHLHVGDDCPVCRQRVTALPDESEIDSLVAVLEQGWKEADSAWKAAEETHTRLEASLEVNSRDLEDKRLRIKNDNSAEAALNGVREACRLCEVDFRPDDADAMRKDITGIAERCAEEEVRTAKDIAAAEIIARALNEASDKATALTRKCAVAAEEKSAIANRLVEAETRITECDRRLKDIDAAEANLISGLEAPTSAFGLSILPGADLKKQAEILTERTTKYKSSIERRTKLEGEIREASSRISVMENDLAAIKVLMPEWTDILNDARSAPKKEIPDGTVLRTSIRETIYSRDEALKRAAAAAREIENYLSKHHNLDRAILQKLDEYSAESIEKIEERQSAMKQRQLTIGATVRTLTDQLTAHDAARPQIQEDDTPASLKEIRELLAREAYETSLKTGRLSQILETDKATRKNQQALLAEIKVLQETTAKWERLATLIGDSKGAKFRKIAQSYVLGDLVEGANRYMKTLSGRYELLVVPGTFIISVRDLYQGNAERAASTLSGGESFLVSLALALALSDIGGRTSPDTLFIDEGFGTLSAEALDDAIATLETLQAKAGRRVGIISHVEELRDRIPVRIHVSRPGHHSPARIQIIS